MISNCLSNKKTQARKNLGLRSKDQTDGRSEGRSEVGENILGIFTGQ